MAWTGFTAAHWTGLWWVGAGETAGMGCHSDLVFLILFKHPDREGLEPPLHTFPNAFEKFWVSFLRKSLLFSVHVCTPPLKGKKKEKQRKQIGVPRMSSDFGFLSCCLCPPSCGSREESVLRIALSGLSLELSLFPAFQELILDHWLLWGVFWKDFI